MTSPTDALARPLGISHVRLTVTDIDRSKEFYIRLLGSQPAMDMSDKRDEPGVDDDPERLYGGCVFALGDQILGLRPVASDGDTFNSTRVGLDHLSLLVESLADLHATTARLDHAGIEHGEVNELTGFGIAILSVQDPDDINLELTAAIG
jgi:glyoxylase I family protein